MSSQQFKQHRRPKHRLTIKLDLEWDADLLTWLESIPKGQRSEEVRQALRNGIVQNEEIKLQSIRSVFAEELDRALAGHQLAVHEHVDQRTKNVEAEEKYGDKLNRMLGGFQSHGQDR